MSTTEPARRFLYRKDSGLATGNRSEIEHGRPQPIAIAAFQDEKPVAGPPES